MKNKLLSLILPVLLLSCLTSHGQTLASVQKIWDKAPHSAFTGLIDYRGRMYCCFRESNRHVPQVTGTDDGKIRILVSDDGVQWDSCALVSLAGVDLRDPELTESADGRLMLVMGGSRYEQGRFLGGITHVAFRDPATGVFSTPVPIEVDKNLFSDMIWMWRVRWHKGTGYGVVYDKAGISLVKSTDGVRYDLVTRLAVDSLPNETDLLFGPDDRITLLVRREKPGAHGLIGQSEYPYTDWSWKNIGAGLGGPRIIRLPDGKLMVATRAEIAPRTYGCALSGVAPDGRLQRCIDLPSGGDCSYPGMVVRDKKLYVSYYSQHEDDRACIYLATIDLP